ncbi:hypothetical protein D3C80_1719870 [compost metagenome]
MRTAHDDNTKRDHEEGEQCPDACQVGKPVQRHKAGEYGNNTADHPGAAHRSLCLRINLRQAFGKQPVPGNGEQQTGLSKQQNEQDSRHTGYGSDGDQAGNHILIHKTQCEGNRIADIKVLIRHNSGQHERD